MSGLRALFSENGAYAVVIAILAVVLFGATGLVVDFGRAFVKRRQLQTVADAAALAGARELPLYPDFAVTSAISYADMNGLDIGPDNVDITSTDEPEGSGVANDTIVVTVHEPVSYTFGRVLGLTEADVAARAVARVGSPSTYGQGVMPFGVMARDTSMTASFGYTFGESVRLKEPAGGGEQGNFFFLDLDDDLNGAPSVYEALEGGGTDDSVSIGDTWSTETGINGSKVGNNLATWITCDHTFEQVASDPDGDGVAEISNPSAEDPTCHRLVVLPIIVNPAYPEGDPLRYNWSSITGKKDILIEGFALFFIEAWGGAGSSSYVDGRFVQAVSPEALGQGPYNPGYGFKVLKLIR